MFFTYKTRWCPRSYREIPYAFSKRQDCGCVDCRLIRAWRWCRRAVGR
jgi:hypothetical protein